MAPDPLAMAVPTALATADRRIMTAMRVPSMAQPHPQRFARGHPLRTHPIDTDPQAVGECERLMKDKYLGADFNYLSFNEFYLCPFLFTLSLLLF